MRAIFSVTPLRFIISSCLVLIISACSQTNNQIASQFSDTPPNIILFIVDDMGLMDSSVAFLTDDKGQPQKHALNHWYKTQNMQNFADKGIRYSNFYAQSVCSPSRISLLTGQNATRHKTTQFIDPDENNRGQFGPNNWLWSGLSPQQYTLATALKNKNYRTIFVGKGHLAPYGYQGTNPVNLNFDISIAADANGAPGSYLAKQNYSRKDGKNSVPDLSQYHGSDTFLTEALTLEANKQIENSVNLDKPFFLNMSHYAVHTPLMYDQRFQADYQTNSNYSEKAKQYATLVAGMDKSLGDLINKLEDLGIADNTLIFFVGDNGSDAPMGEYHDVSSSAPLRGQKGTHYEGGMRVPFMVAWAKPNKDNYWQQKLPIALGAVQTQVASIMDIFPTVNELLGINKSDHIVDGKSLAKGLTGEFDSAKPQTFLMHFPHEHRSSYFTVYRNADWKLIYHYFPKHIPKGKKHTNYNPKHWQYELYNLAQDPSEQTNLAWEYPEVTKRLINEMKGQLYREEALLPQGVSYLDIRF